MAYEGELLNYCPQQMFDFFAFPPCPELLTRGAT
jgi:hypothetical protein